MALPDSYTFKTGAIAAYFDAIQGAEAPERFSIRFLQALGFTSSTDRLIIGVLKDLGFLNDDGVPQERYYQFLDRDVSSYVLAEGIRAAYSGLFAVNKEAHKLDADGAFNKLRTLYKGAKKDGLIKRIASTFVGLCEIANFSKRRAPTQAKPTEKTKDQGKGENQGSEKEASSPPAEKQLVGLDSLQYHINIVLPESRDQAVYDAIFKSMRDHLG